MHAPSLLELSVVAVLCVACNPAPRGAVGAPILLDELRADRGTGGHLPPERSIRLRFGERVREVSPNAYFAALGPDEQVALVDSGGLKLWREGQMRTIAPAHPRGLGAGRAGVVFASLAQAGPGSGVAFMGWDGTVKTLIQAPEGLAGPAGYHKPSISPSGKYVVAFSDLTPMPSLYRISLETGEVRQLSSSCPPSVGAPEWKGEVLVWSTGYGTASLEVATGELTVR